MNTTILEQLIDRLRAAAIYNRHDLAAPSVVLWTDGEGLWSRAIPLLCDAMPGLFVLAPEIADERTGPSTWLRYQLARWGSCARGGGTPPLLYLPGVARSAFRGAAGFPEAARHLFALQFQGQFWGQQNGKDWTPFAFLSSNEGGLGLDLARDRATQDAVGAQLTQVLRAPVASLTGRRLDAADFHGLAAGDPVGLLLEWMATGDGTHGDWSAERWTGFRALCKPTFGLDPDKDGIITAVDKLVAGGGVWDQVWTRYRQAHQAFAGVRKALDLAHPKDLLDDANDRMPVTNRKLEAALRAGLLGLQALPRAQALTRLTQLCAQHAPRADALWADLGEASLARAAVQLKALAEGITAGVCGHDWDTLAAAYLARGWTIDAAAWRAFAMVRDAPDLEAVTAALRAVYLPWLTGLAEQVQGWALGYPGARASRPRVKGAPPPGPGLTGGTPSLPFAGGTPALQTVLVFVDGLRCDLGLELAWLLQAYGLRVETARRWSALPTVTATAKPAWRPLADALIGNSLPEGFEPQLAETGKNLTTQTFRNLLASNGWTWLEATSTGDPTGAAWTEIGTFDHDGHAQGARLAWRLDEELRAVGLRVRDLLAAGWQRAVLVTDHGWLLLPGGLPKADLPGHLTQSRWPRCAVPQPGAQHGFKELPWFWGGGHSVVCAPGVSAFKSGVEYAHGGLSLQEALTLTLTVTAEGQTAQAAVTIGSADWKGLRLRVQLQGGFAGTLLDIRTKPADAGSSVLDPDRRMQPPDADGAAALLVTDDQHAGAAAVLVVLRAGQVVAKQSVTIGGD